MYIGQLDCYERGSEIANMLLNIKTNDTAIYRITDKIGELSLKITEEEEFRDPIQLSEGEHLYVQSDGSMLLTREESWKEAKLGRIFKSGEIYKENETRNWIKSSEYIGILGSHVKFEEKMSKIIDEPYKKCQERIVFINDGAKWQWKWIEAEYPQAIQILDYFHAMENIGKYIKVSVLKSKRTNIMDRIGKALKENGIHDVINQLDQIPRNTKIKREAYETLMVYISNNKKRMDYPKYIKSGLLIGSGAIESAHRTVLQKRMKQSGQRWSKKGLEKMISLRVLNMSGYWNKIRDLITKAA